MEAFEDRPYDTRRALLGISFNALYAWLALRLPVRRPLEGTEIWVYTEAILEGLRRALPASRL